MTLNRDVIPDGPKGRSGTQLSPCWKSWLPALALHNVASRRCGALGRDDKSGKVYAERMSTEERTSFAHRSAATLLTLAALMPAPPAAAQEPFYKGKTISLIVAS